MTSRDRLAIFWAALYAVLTSLKPCVAQVNTTSSATCFSNLGVSDVIFSEKLLFQGKARSKAHCASLCRTQGCVTFTFRPATAASASAAHTCRGHSDVMTAFSTKTVASGTKAYTVKGAASTYRCAAPLAHCNDTAVMLASGCSTTGGSSGLYRINVNGTLVDVYCDQVTDGGGWMVFLRRQDGSVNFKDRTWAQYKAGFGSPTGEHWLGLEVVHKLTQEKGAATRTLEYNLRIDMLRISDQKKCYSVKNHFEIYPETENYKMDVWNEVDDNCGDWFSGHAGYAFSTWDRDNDGDSSTNQAAYHWGGFWHYFDTTANPTGGYGHSGPPSGIYWGKRDMGEWAEACSFVEYKIRRV